MPKPQGWRKESYRHGLSARRIKTKHVSNPPTKPFAILNERYTGFPWNALHEEVRKGSLVYFDGTDDFTAHVFPKGTTEAQIAEYFMDAEGYTLDELTEHLKEMDRIESLQDYASVITRYA